MSFRAQASTTFTMGLVMALASVSSICSGTDAASAAPVAAAPERYMLEDCVLDATPPVEVGRAARHFWFSSIHPAPLHRRSRELRCLRFRTRG